ncbi:MAG: rhodanese-like domain-containing protein [Myxococcales bacterium]|nr:rhodanese-like domain-containing protein [Myxococcales bacterium]
MDWLWLVIVGVFVAMSVMTMFSARPDISGEDARRLVKEGACLVDVRTPQEFASGHLEGALNIPLDVLPDSTSKLPPKETGTVVLYCRSGMRSGRASRHLKAQGYQKVYNLGTMGHWG